MPLENQHDTVKPQIAKNSLTNRMMPKYMSAFRCWYAKHHSAWRSCANGVPAKRQLGQTGDRGHARVVQSGPSPACEAVTRCRMYTGTQAPTRTRVAMPVKSSSLVGVLTAGADKQTNKQRERETNRLTHKHTHRQINIDRQR